MAKELTITIPEQVYHRLEVCAAKDNESIQIGTAKLLTHIVQQYDNSKINQTDKEAA